MSDNPPPHPQAAPPAATPPGEGERRAQRGYTRQYDSSAAAIYAGLERGNLEWVGVADRGAGVADDVVLGLTGCVVGHQFKTSRFPEQFRLRTLLLGSAGSLSPLVAAWQALKRSNPGRPVEVRLVRNDYSSFREPIFRLVVEAANLASWQSTGSFPGCRA